MTAWCVFEIIIEIDDGDNEYSDYCLRQLCQDQVTAQQFIEDNPENDYSIEEWEVL